MLDYFFLNDTFHYYLTIINCGKAFVEEFLDRLLLGGLLHMIAFNKCTNYSGFNNLSKPYTN